MNVLLTPGVMNTSPAVLGRTGVSTGIALRQRVQQCLRLLQIGRVKALGEPAVDWREERLGFDPLALLLPQPTEAHRRTQLPGFGLLAAGDGKGLLEAGFGLGCLQGRLA